MPNNDTHPNRYDTNTGLMASGLIRPMAHAVSGTKTLPTHVHFVGLGGAGSNMVEYIQKKGTKGKFTCISHPVRPNLDANIQFVHFLPPGTSYVHNGVESIRVSEMNQPIEVPPQVWSLFLAQEPVVLLAGLGGYTGTYMMEALIPYLQEQQKTFLGLACIPFWFEEQRKKQAEKTTLKLNKYENFHSFDLDTLIRGDKELLMAKALQKVNEAVHVYCLKAIENWVS